LTYALEESGLPKDSGVLKRSTSYLLRHQQTKKGDWAIHNANVSPGGWGFSENNTINPDVDDTQAALHAIFPYVFQHPNFRSSWNRGVRWLLSMQNKDGGWPAFEKNTDNEWLTLLPFNKIEAAGIDPSSADLTGRTLEFLGSKLKLDLKHPSVKAGVKWLLHNQQKDGSWYGRWGVCYIYGTWAAVTGLKAVGVPSKAPAIQKAVDWLLQIQHSDGGWGESCSSDVAETFRPLDFSTPSQTAWAVNTLTYALDKNTSELKNGCKYLMKKHTEKETTYPTGAGLPGSFYIRYHSYNEIWPLLALGQYRKKFIIKEGTG
jgi:sporulenol synthase